jgi:DNA-directed RNA polymerase subunit RPC12/RpoP
MSQVNQVEIRCLNCGLWFPSPIYFGDSDSFDTSTLIGNQAQCPHCGRMTGCNKENMRVYHQKGGFVGKDTV